MILNRKVYEYRALLNRTRAFSALVRTGRGEGEIRAWIDAFMRGRGMEFSSALSQKILWKAHDHEVAPALMLASAVNKFPVMVRAPRAWREFVRSKGATIHPLSSLLWMIEVAQAFRQGIATFRALLANTQEPEPVYAVLCGIHKAAFTTTLSGAGAQDFLSWFRGRFPFPAQWIVPAGSCDLPTADGASVVKWPFPALPAGSGSRGQFIRAASAVTARAALGLLTGRWREAYMLADRIQAEYVKAMPPDRIARLYGFTNAEYIYRPLWTYEAEKKGAEIAMFFYSVNTFDMRLTAGGDIGFAPGYSTMTWPVIYTQHENHADFLRRAMRARADIHVCGLIPYEDSGRRPELKAAASPRILYLDVQPFRRAFMASIGRPCHIYAESVAIQTFRDIASAARGLRAELLMKPKRFVGNRLSTSYKRMLESAAHESIVHVVDSGVSPAELIRCSDIILCQPFTTAALTACAQGKPVAYYDAPGLFEKDQPACMGIPLLHGPEELSRWLREAANVSQTAA